MRRASWAALALATVGLGAGVALVQPPDYELAFIDVGQGDATLLSSGGTGILIDTGPETSGLVRSLERSRLGELAYVVLTHLDADHVGGTAAVLARYPRAQLALSESFRDHPDLPGWLGRWRREDSEVRWIPSDARLALGAANVIIHSPPRSEAVNDNDASLAIHIRVGASSAVLTGDLGEAMERELAETGDWSAQVMKCGHHGSAGSTSEVWLAEVRPRFAVASCGRNNRFGHPHPDVVRRVTTVGAKLYRTDTDGTVRFRATAAGFEPVH